MNSKQMAVITLAACGLAVLAAGCCSPQKQKTNRDTPRITMQPDDTEVSTNGSTNLVVKIRWENKDAYRFAWFKEVSFDCPEKSGRPVFTYELQTRPGWDRPVLEFEKPKFEDQGNYFCQITHELNCIPPKAVQTRTRMAFLQVYQADSLSIFFTNHMAGNPQVVSRSFPYQGQYNTPTCNLPSYQGSQTFNSDVNHVAFKSPNHASTCTLIVSRWNGSSFDTLNTSAYTVKVYPVIPPAAGFCPPTVNSTNLQFSAPSSITYQFVVYLKIDDGVTYQLSVQFTPP